MSANNRSGLPAEFFVAGGTLPASAPSYVSRPADDQLLTAAASSQFCYVLTTRQMGKSSLMVRTARSLKQQGVRTAIIDLTTMGGKTEETWYLDFLTELSDQLSLTQDVEAWWQERATLGAVRRFSNFLRDVALEEISDQIVIFVDEIDFTLGLPFADDFFAAVRATYNARALDARFNRLTFIFLGVAAPADLIKDRTRTPFNIGEGIVLRDFDRTDAAVLPQGLEAAYPGQGQSILDRIFYWTAGHPYLTQTLCREVVDTRRAGPWTEMEVDRVVGDLFLSDQTNREQNLQFVQDRVLKNPQRRELLRLYGKVRGGKAVTNDEQSMLQNQLKLAGLVTTDAGNLRIHNEIYRVVFDAKWIKANTPRDSNRIVAYAAVALTVVVVAVAGFILLRNSYVQQESDRLQLEFTQVGTAAERLDRLAQLFDLQGILTTSNFDDAARRLFFDMNLRQDQLALFSVQDNRIVGVIDGLYTALADANKNGENDELLKAMRDALQKQGTSVDASRLYQEIDYWLKARDFARQNQYNDALAEYGKAIQANADDGNPATHFERAQIMLGLPSPIYPQALSDLDAAMAAAGKVSEAKSSEPELETTATPVSTQLPATISTLEPSQAAGSLTPLPSASKTAVPTISATPAGRPPVPPDAGQRPFRSQFITFVQIASAVRRLIDGSPGLVAFLANSAESDYGNLRVANLVRTVTPTPEATTASEVKPSATHLTETPPPALTPAPDAVAELLRRTNELRQNNKLPPYTLNAALNQVALAHSQDMAIQDQLTDTGADGSTAAQRITNAGYGAGQPSEAICSGPGETAAGAWGRFTADSADLANLLNTVNTDIGIGVAQNQSNTYYTIVFGKPAQVIAVTPQSSSTIFPVLTPPAGSTLAPASVQSTSTANGLTGQVIVTGNTGSIDLPEFQDRISFELAVFDPAAGKTNGAGITAVDMHVIDPAGTTVFQRTDLNTRYFAFGGGEPDCTVWNFGEHGDTWPDGAPVCAGTDYQAFMQVNTTDAAKNGASYSFAFSITGKYPACPGK